MVIQEHQRGAVVILKPDGPIVAADADEFRTRLQQEMKKHLGRVVLDISAVSFIDSRGLESLVDVAEEVSQSGRWLKLCAATQTVRQVLELTGLSSQFEHFNDAGSAVRSFL